MWDHVSAVGQLWGNLDQFPPHRLIVAEEQLGTLGSRLDVVAVRGEAALVLQAHHTAPYQPCCSLDQQTAGQYQWWAWYP